MKDEFGWTQARLHGRESAVEVRAAMFKASLRSPCVVEHMAGKGGNHSEALRGFPVIAGETSWVGRVHRRWSGADPRLRHVICAAQEDDRRLPWGRTHTTDGS